MKDEELMLSARRALSLTQSQMAAQLGWATAKHVYNIESGKREMQQQTRLAVECLLRRSGKFIDPSMAGILGYSLDIATARFVRS